jgi:hypothetical protein
MSTRAGVDTRSRSQPLDETGGDEDNMSEAYIEILANMDESSAQLLYYINTTQHTTRTTGGSVQKNDPGPSNYISLASLLTYCSNR